MVKNNSVLFLGERSSPLIKWLVDSNHRVVAHSDKVLLNYVKQEKFDYLISYGYRHIITKDVIKYFNFKGINLHISYLPWNRGSDPNLWSFVEGTKKGVSIHLLHEKLDSGDILIQREVDFDMAADTLASSYDKLHLEIQSLFITSWPLIKKNKLLGEKQQGKGSYHRSSDKDGISLPKGWSTPVSDLLDIDLSCR